MPLDLYDRIAEGLQRQSPRWVPVEVIYAKMAQEGYIRSAVSSVLKKIASTPPFARIWIEGKDYSSLDALGLHVGGTYFRASPISKKEVERLKSDLAWYETI